MHVVYGPKNCGKTAFLGSFFDDKEVEVLVINCRNVDASTPAGFINSMLTRLIPKAKSDMQPQLFDLAARAGALGLAVFSGIKVSGIGSDLSMGFDGTKAAQASKPTTSAAGLTDVYDALSELLTSWLEDLTDKQNNKYKWPVLFIDEANVMMSWADSHSKELFAVLRFLISLSKEKQLCHVVMATSEYGFQTFLDARAGQGVWRLVAFGDFEATIARDYLKWQLAGLGDEKCAKAVDDVWPKVHQICGGNAGTLGQLAGRIIEQGDIKNWHAALMGLSSLEGMRIELLADGVPGGFSGLQYADAALLLLSSEHGVVPRQEMRDVLGRHVTATAADQTVGSLGEAALQSLVRENVLSLRSPSEWATDLPASVSGGSVLVTASSALVLHSLRRQARVLYEYREVCEQRQQGRAASAEEELRRTDKGSLFVCNFARTPTTENKLRELFKQCGSGAKVSLLDSCTQGFAGMAYVQFDSPKDAIAACGKLDLAMFEDRLLHVLPPRPTGSRLVPQVAGGSAATATAPAAAAAAVTASSQHVIQRAAATVYVTNLAYATTTDALKAVFDDAASSSGGYTRSLTIKYNRGKSNAAKSVPSGRASVELNSAAVAKAVFGKLQGCSLDGRVLRLTLKPDAP